MKHLLFILLLLPFAAISQKKKSSTYFAGTIQVETKNSGVGGRIGGGINMQDIFLVGFGIGLTKFGNLDKPVIPIYTSITMAADFKKKITPVVFIEPGYGAYNRTVGRINTTGGFYFFGGAGLGFSGSSKVKGVLNAGYYIYSFNTEGIKSKLEGLAIRFTIIGL